MGFDKLLTLRLRKECDRNVNMKIVGLVLFSLLWRDKETCNIFHRLAVQRTILEWLEIEANFHGRKICIIVVLVKLLLNSLSHEANKDNFKYEKCRNVLLSQVKTFVISVRSRNRWNVKTEFQLHLYPNKVAAWSNC